MTGANEHDKGSFDFQGLWKKIKGESSAAG
jgi:hypothetical protein